MSDPSNDTSASAHPKVPRDGVVNRDGRPPTTAESDTLSDVDTLFDQPAQLDARLTDSVLNMVTLVGPISADTVVDVSPTDITFGAVYEPTAEDDHGGNICSLASHDTCVRTTGTQKIDGRYVPKRLEFEKTVSFTEEVESLRDLKQEWKQLFAVTLTLQSASTDQPGDAPF